jgi:outer membrane lipoprotein-sorting protein
MLLVLLPVAVGAQETAPAEKLPAGREIVERSIEAIGGKEALKKINNRVGEGTLEIKGLGIKGKLVSYQARPNKMYTHVEIEGIGTIEQGSDGEVVWEMSTLTGGRVKQGEERAALLLFSHFDESELLEKFEKIECVGVEEVGGEACYKVVATPKEAMPITTYYSKQSGLPLKAVLTFPHQAGKLEVENLMQDYREVDGLLLPHRNVEKVMVIESLVTIDKFRHNVELPEDRFAPPDAIKALMKKAAEEAAAKQAADESEAKKDAAPGQAEE